MILRIDQFLRSSTFRWLRILQFLVAIIVFSYAVLMPASQVQSLNKPDWLMHFCGNLLLFMSASVAFYGRLRIPLLIFFLLPYSLLLELAQRYAPGRSVDPRDMLYNLAGLTTGLLIVYIMESGWRRLYRRATANAAV